MITRMDHSNATEAQEILRIQIPAYRVEAEQIGFSDIPALRDTVESIQTSKEIFCGYYDEGRLAGVISYETNPSQPSQYDIVEICRLVVDPEYFRRGIAQALLTYVQDEEKGAKTFIVGTGKRNTPAVSLYQKNGFNLVKEQIIAEQLEYVVLQKTRNM